MSVTAEWNTGLYVVDLESSEWAGPSDLTWHYDEEEVHITFSVEGATEFARPQQGTSLIQLGATPSAVRADWTSGSLIVSSHAASRYELIVSSSDNTAPSRVSRAAASVAVERRAKSVFGGETTVWFVDKHDADRVPSDYRVAYVYAPVATTEELIAGEEKLIAHLVDDYQSVEDDFVIVCHRQTL